MNDSISRLALYHEISKMEDLARQRVLDTPISSPAYMRYVAQMNERTTFKHMIADAPSVEAVPVVHGEWIADERGIYFCSVCDSEGYWDSECGQQLFDHCPYCGADMRKKV